VIILSAINSSGSNWISRLIRTAIDAMSPGLDGPSFIVEPFSLNAWSGFSDDNEYAKLLEDNAWLRGRWHGRNMEVGKRHRDALFVLLDAALKKWPNMQGFKTLDMQYHALYREYFGDDVKFVALYRDLPGFLSCIARRKNRINWYSHYWYYPVREPTPWWNIADAMIKEFDIPEKLYRLTRAAAYHEVMELWMQENHPFENSTSAFFGEMASNWDYATVELLEWCGLEPLDDESLFRWAAIVRRDWDGASLSRHDVNTVLGYIQDAWTHGLII